MKCPNCREASFSEQRENHRYVESGLSNVVLLNVIVRKCQSCGERAVVISRIEELHRTIAQHIVEKTGRLTGEEMRFLRKRHGMTARAFADLIGVDPATMSRWENGEPIGASSDRLIRLVFVVAEKLPKYEVEQLARITDERTPVKLRLGGTKHWADETAA